MRVIMGSSYGYWGELNYDALLSPPTNGRGAQIGGGETAMMMSALEWARAGHEVFLFAQCKPGRQHGVDMLSTEMFVDFVTSVDADVMIAWDHPHAFRFADRCEAHVLAFQLNHAQVGVFSHVVDEYWHPSQWHRDRFVKEWPEIDERKTAVLMTNGVDPERYAQAAAQIMKVPGRVAYTSSPDRGLHHLLRIWPAIKQQVPQAELHVYYDVERWLQNDADMKVAGMHNVTRERAELIRPYFMDPTHGIVFKGGVSKWELASAQVSAPVLCYPCDPVAPTEGFSMTVLEGITAGCDVLTTNADALGELWSGRPGVTVLPLPVHDDVWADALVATLRRSLEPSAEYVIRNPVDFTWKAVVGRQIARVGSVLYGNHS